MAEELAIPEAFARKYQRLIRWRRTAYIWGFAMMAAMIGFALTPNWWFAFVPVIAFLPAAWVINLRCYRCHWPVVAVFGTAPNWAAKDQYLAPEFSDEASKAPACCSKCRAPFAAG